VIDVLVDANLQPTVVKALEAAVDTAPGLTQLMKYWIRAGSWAEATALLGRTAKAGGAAWNRAAYDLVENAVKAERRQTFEAVLTAHVPQLAADGGCWGISGWGLTHFQQNRRAVQWMNDWRSRSDAAPWMLANLAYSLRALGKRQAAAEIHAVAAAAAVPDHSSTAHALWAALDAAINDRMAEARQLLAKAGKATREKDVFVQTLVQTLMAPEGTPLRTLLNQLRVLAKANPGYIRMPFWRRELFATVLALGRQHGWKGRLLCHAIVRLPLYLAALWLIAATYSTAVQILGSGN
jgi:hypothetical protein